MLNVGYPVSGFFQLVLGIPPKLTLDTVNGGLGAPQILSEEGFKLWPRDGSEAFVALLVLGLSEADGNTKEGGGKGGMIHPCGAWGLEIVFTLLIKVVVIHVRFSGVGFPGPSFE